MKNKEEISHGFRLSEELGSFIRKQPSPFNNTTDVSYSCNASNATLCSFSQYARKGFLLISLSKVSETKVGVEGHPMEQSVLYIQKTDTVENLQTAASGDHNYLFGTTSFNSLQANIAFHAKNSHLFCTTNQVTGFCMKCNTGLKWVKGNTGNKQNTWD